MKVCGVSFGKNVVKFDYPIKEAIQSILPICDHVIVAVGESEDDTLNYIKSVSTSKLEILSTKWDESLREGGRVLADETNKALKAVPEEYDWIFYIQGDEVLHEKYLSIVKREMEKYKDDESVDGLLFDYKHFYGSYAYVADSYNWYRREIRVIKNRKDIYSYRDAQGFRKGDNQKLKVKKIDACIYHYGWVKDPVTQQEKQKTFHQLWHSGEALKKKVDDKEKAFDYSGIDSLVLFNDSHPEVMGERISKQDWDFEFVPENVKLSLKNRVKRGIEKLTGVQLGEYRNYKIT